MLVPAVLRKDEIVKAFYKYYYTTDMMYETGSRDNWCPNISECPDEHTFQYASVDPKGNLLGYFAYSVDWYSSRAYNFGMISFDRGNVLFVSDVFDKMEQLVNQFHRVEWRMVGGNPAERGYDHFIEKHDGSKHVLKDCIKDKYGKYHDDIIYEVVSSRK